ncbi:hypothetical protein C0995_000032 [Termitomyces sp. Mi166|nr:hypothetical protein C0995_000032 [Termitomyces sp. Mi166\
MGKPLEAKESSNSLTVRDNRTGKVYNVPIVDNSISATAFKAMSALPAPGEREENETEKGLRVSDRGFLNTAVMRSTITYIDGEAGGSVSLTLKAATNNLCVQGDTPSNNSHSIPHIWKPLAEFENEVIHHGTVHADAEQFCRSFRYDAHPMAILTSAFAYLGSYYREANPSLQGQNIFTSGDKASLELMDKQIYRLIGKATTLAAMAYRVRQGRDFVTPPTGLSYTGSFLYQMDHLGEENYVPNPVLEKALDVLFLLHADHELNASATTVLQTGSSLVDPYSAIAAGCASLYGPLHGGANEAVIRMLISIGKPENVPAFIEAVKKREKVLSGFGHRVYKTSDPRSFIVRKTADEVFKITGKDELLETAMALHDAAMKDEYFIKRKLAPNVDFCGLIYRAMGFPLDFFPVLFAVPRVVGWLAHWRQVWRWQMMLQEGGVKIWRPRQIYVGAGKRDYVPVDKRVAVEGPRVTPSKVFHSGTPDFVQCQKSEISWAPTTGPYNLIVVAAEDPCGDPLFDLGDHDDTSIHWTAALPTGTKVQLSVEDSAGDEAWSGVITVGQSNDSSCVPNSVLNAVKSESASESASASASAQASSVKASSTRASSTTVQSTPATTLVVTPTATVNVAGSTAEGPSPSAVGAAASNPLGFGNGAPSLRQSTPVVVLGALAAVLAFSL